MVCVLVVTVVLMIMMMLITCGIYDNGIGVGEGMDGTDSDGGG